jgi:hypothetical protein
VLNCALAEGCSFSCTSFCGEGKCDDSGECVPTGNGAQGVKQVWKTRVVQNGWFNTTGDLQLVYFEAPAGQTQVRQKWPLAYFLGGGYGGEVNVKASSMENKLDSDYSSWVYSPWVQTDVEGCREDARDDLWFKGVYEFSRDEGEGSTAPLKVSVLTLDNKPESYIGYAPAGVDEGSACSKYNQPDVIDDAEHGISMKTVPLCALLWFDQTKAYGTCLDSVYSYEKDENHLSLTRRYFASVHARGTNPRSDCLDSSCPNAVKREGDDEPATDEMCKLHCLCVISTAGDPDSGLNENHGHQHLDANERPPFVVAKIGAVASQNGCANKRCDYDVWDSLGNLLTAVHADKDLSKVSNGECGVGKNPTEIEDSSTGNLDANSNVVCLLKHPDDYIVSIRERIYSYWLAGWHDRSDTEYDAEWTSAACQPD